MANTIEELITQIKDRLDIVDVVSHEVILKRRGNHYWGLCPFHKEKTPSFTVNPDLGIYKCFGCGAGGDVINFIMKTQNKEFMEVITELAERFGLEIPKRSGNFKSNRGLKEEMIKACKIAAKFYNLKLLKDKSPATSKVLEYLTSRGITKEIIEKYSIGLSSNLYAEFYKKFRNEIPEDTMEKAGLIIKTNENEYIDRFRGRIIIPIQNENGEVVAFGARALTSEQSPKYLNSSDSAIYNKSKLLFGLYTAKDAIKEQSSLILMEGYFDVISAQVHGIGNAVGTCGTSLTPDHIKLISRYTRKIYLSFDTDSAGQKATKRNAELIKQAFQGLGNIKQFDESYLGVTSDKYSCEIRVISPPEGKDPDEFIRSAGAAKYREYLEQAPLLLDYQINAIMKEKPQSPLEKTKIVKELIPILKEIQNEIVKSEYVKMIAQTLNINENALEREINKATAFDLSQNQEMQRIVKKNIPILEKAQKNLLSIFFVNDKQYSFDEIKQMIGDTEFTDETLINVKNTIDKLTCTVNNVKELIKQLYSSTAENSELQAIITDLISIAETFQNLDENAFATIVKENIHKINQFRLEKENEKLRNLYKNVNNDETEALKIQIRLRDKINNRFGENK